MDMVLEVRMWFDLGSVWMMWKKGCGIVLKYRGETGMWKAVCSGYGGFDVEL